MSVAFGSGIGMPFSIAECGRPENNAVVIQSIIGQTANQLEFWDPTGIVLSAVDVNGSFSGAAASPAGAVILAPATSLRNVIQPTADVVPLTIKGFAGQTSNLQNWTNSVGVILASLNASGVLQAAGSNLAGTTTGTLTVLSTSSLSGTLLEAADTSNNTVAFPLEVRHTVSTGPGAPNIGAGVFFSSESDTEGQFNSLASVSGIALTNTFGAQVGRLRLRAAIAGVNTDLAYFDGSVGTQIAVNAGAKLGFFNAAPVVQRVGASAAGIAAVIDPNAAAALTAIQAALNTLGLVTAPA